MADKRIEMGAVAAAHGIKGQFKVKAFGDDPLAIADYGPVSLKDGTLLSLRAHSQAKGFVLCSAKEVTSRNHAESLRGELLYIDRALLPQSDEDEIYHADLMDFTLLARLITTDQPSDQSSVRAQIQAIGVVIGIHDFGAGTLIEVMPDGKNADGKIGGRKTSLMLPFGDAYDPIIDEGTQTITMDVAETWLDDHNDKRKKGHGKDQRGKDQRAKAQD